VGKPKGKRPLDRFRRRWEDNIKVNLREIRWGSMDWIHLLQGRDQWGGGGFCEHGSESSGFINFGNS
jgi:hypothetical protein